MPGWLWYLIGCVWGSFLTFCLMDEDKSQENEHNSDCHWYFCDYNNNYCYRINNSSWSMYLFQDQ